MITSFSVLNYKGFRDQQVVELAPLTLFFGANSSGKSTLLRVLPWLAESMADPRSGPCLDGQVAREALWTDLAHVPTRPVVLRVEWSDGREAAWALRGGALPGSCEIGTISLSVADGRYIYDNDGDDEWISAPGVVDQEVRGLLPMSDGDQLTLLGLPRSAWRIEAQWLAGIRAGVPRVEKALAAAPARLASDGSGVARHLYFWDRRSDDEPSRQALKFTERFFSRLGFELRAVDVASGFFRLDVQRRGAPGAPVNLVDTGEGLTQVLAPLVALARAAAGIGPRLVALEQPELHLHTDAQRALADSLAEASETSQVLVETHSEVLLAAVQLAVATGRLDPARVALYWVGQYTDGASYARRVALDAQGRIDGGWPLNAFSDLLSLKTELSRAQRNRAARG